MIKGFVSSLLLVLACFSNLSLAGINDISNSVCRIDGEKGYCTGWCYKQDSEYYYLISAGHFPDLLAGRVQAKLFHSGEVKDVPAEKVICIYEKGTTNDLSVVRIKKTDLGDYPAFEVLKLGDNHNSGIIWSYGCPDGKWPTAFKGRNLLKNQNSNEGLWKFSPPVIPGRSGSPVFNEDGTEVIGMVVMVNAIDYDDGSQVPKDSVASSIQSIKKILKENNLEAE